MEKHFTVSCKILAEDISVGGFLQVGLALPLLEGKAWFLTLSGIPKGLPQTWADSSIVLISYFVTQ